jgi:hypothetical protein
VIGHTVIATPRRDHGHGRLKSHVGPSGIGDTRANCLRHCADHAAVDPPGIVSAAIRLIISFDELTIACLRPAV